MGNFDRVRVLNELRPFLRLINAYNSDYFRDSNWRGSLRSVCIALCATIMICLIPIFISLGAWYLIENEAAMRKVVVALPILFTFGQTDATFVALILRHRIINETIDRLQKVVDQREFKLCHFS